MDRIDRQLLALLRLDGRAPVLDLARKLKLSRTATQARMAKLKNNGSIRRFTIEEGGGAVTAHVFIKLAAGHQCASVVPKIKPLAAAEMIHTVTGEHDLLVKITAGNVEELEACRAAIAHIEGVASMTTALTLADHRR